MRGLPHRVAPLFGGHPGLLLLCPPQRPTTLRRSFGRCVELQSEAVSQPGKVVEDANDMRDLKARLVVEAQVSQRLPIFFNHSR